MTAAEKIDQREISYIHHQRRNINIAQSRAYLRLQCLERYFEIIPFSPPLTSIRSLDDTEIDDATLLEKATFFDISDPNIANYICTLTFRVKCGLLPIKSVENVLKSDTIARAILSLSNPHLIQSALSYGVITLEEALTVADEQQRKIIETEKNKIKDQIFIGKFKEALQNILAACKYNNLTEENSEKIMREYIVNAIMSGVITLEDLKHPNYQNKRYDITHNLDRLLAPIVAKVEVDLKLASLRDSTKDSTKNNLYLKAKK